MQTHLRRNKKLIGTLSGILAAMCYGTNPLGALHLYQEGITTNCVLFYRFGLAALIMLVVLRWRGESLKVSWHEFAIVSALGILFTFSSLTLYLSFHHIAAGIASTILFSYPIMTVILMGIFFRERASWHTWVSILVSFVGVLLLYRNDGTGQPLSTLGVVLVFISALSYALYIIVVGHSKIRCSPFKINLYVLLWCAAGMLIYTAIGNAVQPDSMPLVWPPSGRSWFFVLWLALVPGIGALTLMVYASKYVGATSTAILGALEPLTAVIIGILLFHEPFTPHLAIGILLTISAVVLVSLPKSEAKK